MNTKFFQYILFAFVVGAGIFIASCSKDEDDTVSTDPDGVLVMDLRQH
jgi:hypothetical protein